MVKGAQAWMAGCLLLASARALAGPLILTGPWEVGRERVVSDVQAATVVSTPDGTNPALAPVAVGRGGASAPHGVWLVETSGLTIPVWSLDHVTHLLATEEAGLFVSDDQGGEIYRLDSPGGAPEVWVSGFAPNDDDPMGMARVPVGFSGFGSSAAATAGRALVVDRGFFGLPALWAWDPLVPEGETLLVSGAPLVGPVDVAVDLDRIWIVDPLAPAGQRLLYLSAAGDWVFPALSPAPVEPAAVVVDPLSGSLLVADRQFNRLLRIEPDDGTSTSLAIGLDFSDAGGVPMSLTADGRTLLIATSSGTTELWRCDSSWGGPDCDGDGVWDPCSVVYATADDCNQNGIPDACDIASGVSTECDGDTKADECLLCPAAEVVFVVDTSVSMADDGAALCEAIAATTSIVSSLGVSNQIEILGIDDTGAESFPCLDSDVATAYGTAVPGPPPEFATLLDCPGGGQDPNEDWGRAASVVMGHKPWAAGTRRIVMVLTDEGPHCGDPTSVPGADGTVAAQAIQLALQEDTALHIRLGSGSGSSVVALAEQIALQSSGSAGLLANDPAVMAADWVGVMTAGCAAQPDCNFNDTADACELADADCNTNGQPDECDISAGDSDDLDLDGAPDECVEPALGCAYACCAAKSTPGCDEPWTQSCVCELNVTCCTSAWSIGCVQLARQVCGTPCPAPPACCSTASPAAGCGGSLCEACVCAAHPDCCLEGWSSTCSALASTSCNAVCDCGGPPQCVPAAGDVTGDGSANVADSQCIINTILWALQGSTDAIPECLPGVPLRGDITCDCNVGLADVLASIRNALDLPLLNDADIDGNGCPDLCEL